MVDEHQRFEIGTIAKYDGTCTACTKPISKEVDHVVPITLTTERRDEEEGIALTLRGFDTFWIHAECAERLILRAA